MHACMHAPAPVTGMHVARSCNAHRGSQARRSLSCFDPCWITVRGCHLSGSRRPHLPAWFWVFGAARITAMRPFVVPCMHACRSRTCLLGDHSPRLSLRSLRTAPHPHACMHVAARLAAPPAPPACLCGDALNHTPRRAAPRRGSKCGAACLAFTTCVCLRSKPIHATPLHLIALDPHNSIRLCMYQFESGIDPLVDPMSDRSTLTHSCTQTHAHTRWCLIMIFP